MSEGASTSAECDDVIIQCTCRINKKNYIVSLTNTELRWHIAEIKVKKDIQAVRIVDILSVSLKSSSKVDTTNDSVCVSYVKQEKKFMLKSCSVVFTPEDLQIVNDFHQKITDLVTNVGQRPKKLLVLINPVSGRSKGSSVYTQKVAPIFKNAGIETDVIVTERAHHAEEILSTYDLKSVDGLIVVGGDGIYHEAVNGLMKRLTTDQGLNADDPDETLPPIDLPIGIIPCGTGNGIAYACYGNYDVTTAALSIAIGYLSPSNILQVHSGNKLLAYSILLIGYGTWGDLIHTTESRRSQGRLRYPIAMIEQMLIKTLRRMDLTIQYIPEAKPVKENVEEDNEDSAKPTAKDKTETSDKLEQSDGAVPSSSPRLEPVTVKKNVIGATIFLLQPAEVFGSGSGSRLQPNLSRTSMMLSTSSSRTKYISFMFDLMTLNFNDMENRDDIVNLPGKQWTIKLDEPSQPETENWQLERTMNIDGEIYRLPATEFQAKVLPESQKLFSNMPYATNRVTTKK